MYSQFGFTEGVKLNDALKVLNSDLKDNWKYQEALSSALQVLKDSRAYEGKKPEWAVDVISAYREIGKNLLAHIDFVQSYPEELLSLEKEFEGIINQYDDEDTMEKMRVILRDLTYIDNEKLSGDGSQTLTDRLKMTLNDFASISGIMNQYEVKDSSELDMALRERQELLEQAEMFERNL